jgi:hypothetical protein
MSAYDLILFIVAVVTVVPALGFWRVCVINGRRQRGESW